MGLAGGVLLLIGFGWLVYALSIDTTVQGYSISGYSVERVHNLGLMNEKTNETIAAAATALVGVILLVGSVVASRKAVD